MDNELITTLIPIVAIGFIGLLVGGIIGALISGSMRSSSPKDGKSPGKNYAQVIRLWRDRRNGKLLVETDGEYFPSVDKLSVRQKTVLLQNIDELQLWTGVEALSSRIQPVAVSSQQLEKPAEKPLPSKPAENGGFDQPLEKVPAAAAAKVQSDLLSTNAPTQAFTTLTVAAASEHDNSATVKPPSLDLRDIFVRAMVPEVKPKDNEGPKSIAAQVDEILQEKLPHSSLHDRSIRLLEIPEKGLVVMVDGQAYDGVGDVPDAEVRQLIQECVAEWEKKG